MLIILTFLSFKIEGKTHPTLSYTLYIHETYNTTN